MRRRSLLPLLTLPLLAAGCTPAGDARTAPSLPSLYAHFTANVQVWREGDYAVVHTDDVPDHPSCYFPQDSRLYQPDPDIRQNPNQIEAQSITLRLPLNPQPAATHRDTPLGPIGVSVNGVVFFNQYAAGYSPLAPELPTLDQYNGHPQQTGVYHYHIEPTWLTSTRGKSSLMGLLLDGYPVYGPVENGRTVTNRDLDAYHGHFGPTPDCPGGIYHYHVTAQDPYINGGQFYGVPGRLER